MTDALDRVLLALPRAYAGPGGAVAVLRDGAVVVRHAWGWANAERRIPFTPATLFRMCSVTKQFTCGVVLESFPDPAVLDGDVRARLPLLARAPGALHLCHNQSGLRDYWAVAMLLGAAAEGVFGDAEAARLIGGTRSLQFAPGTQYSYVNQNFRILSDIVQERTGRGFGELLRTRIFDRAGMGSAVLAADTRAMPDGTEGYEGTQASGFRAAENRILWTGDAGLGASLDDMIAWERFIDATRDDEDGLYRRLSAPVTFADGAAAPYGFGLGRRTEFGRVVTAHGGALRGWRCQRLHVRGERVSVVVLFNHMADAGGAATELLGAVLGVERGVPAAGLAMPRWLGAYVEPESGLSARIEASGGSHVRLRFGHSAERLAIRADGGAGGEGTRLRAEADGLWMDRPQENVSVRLEACEAGSRGDVAGRYWCAELEAALVLEGSGGVLYGAFSGVLGQGRMELLEPVGLDVWALPCPRALDHTPPGDWTVAVRREGGGAGGGGGGCGWARGLWYGRV